MRRSLGRAARTLAVAGAFLGLVDASQAQLFRFWGSKTTASQPPAPPPTAINPLHRLEEIKVELAWMNDPSTFPCPMTARVRGRLLEVSGLAPNQPVKQLALELAHQTTSMPIADSIKIKPGVAARPPSTEPMESLANNAATLLARTFSDRSHDLQIQAQATGQLVLTGTVLSYEEKLNISRVLRQVRGVTSIDNQLTVAPSVNHGQMVTFITSDGRLALSGEAAQPAAPPPASSIALPAAQEPSAAPASPPAKVEARQPEFKPAMPLTMVPVKQAESLKPIVPASPLKPVSAQGPAPVSAPLQPLTPIHSAAVEPKNPLLIPPPVPQGLKPVTSFKNAPFATTYAGASRMPEAAPPASTTKLVPVSTASSTPLPPLRPVTASTTSSTFPSRLVSTSSTTPSSGDQISDGVAFIEESGASRTAGAKAPQPAVTPALLQRRVEVACAGLARDVKVEVMPDGTWTVRVKVPGNLDKQVTEKVLRLEEMSSPRIKLELTLLP